MNNKVMTLEELTGQESGIVVYDDGDIIVCNWSSYGVGALPVIVNDMIPIALDKYPEGFEVASVDSLNDIREALPGKIWVTEIDDNGRIHLDSDLSVVWDPKCDILRLYLDGSDERNETNCTSGKVYTINDDTKIIVPDGWN